jgi:hypothetical protein
MNNQEIVTTHYSRWCIDLIRLLGGRLAKTESELFTIPKDFTQIFSNACNQGWGVGYVSAGGAHLKGDRATCKACQAMFTRALSEAPDLIHIMPDHHLTMCGQCTCDRQGLKGAPDAEAQAFMKNGLRGSITCPGCIAVIEETQKLMANARAGITNGKGYPSGRALAEVIGTVQNAMNEAESKRKAKKKVDKKSRR